MRYLLKSGVLCEEKGTKILSRIKHTIWCTSKTVVLSDDTPILKITIRDPDTSEDKRGNKRFREYVMLDRNDTLIAVGYPAYAEVRILTGTGGQSAECPVWIMPSFRSQKPLSC